MTEVVEGFMGSEVPATKLDDGNVKFWIPWFEWERVRDALNEAMESFPEYTEKAQSD